MRSLLILFLLSISGFVMSQITDPVATEVWEPVPRQITPGLFGSPPSDAIVLFDGQNLDEWMSIADSSDAHWHLDEGSMTVRPKMIDSNSVSGNIMTKRVFGDVQLHIEWRAPFDVEGPGQDKGNSGIFLQRRYEVQVLDMYDNSTYSNGQTGSIYKQSIPLVNACRPTGEWQAYDIIYKAPIFNADGHRVSAGNITVLHNGVLIQNHFEIRGTTEYIGLPKNIAHGKAALELQDHGNPTSYRNIWVREL